MSVKRILVLLIVLLMIACPALAGSYYPSEMAATGYNRAQWLSNGKSRALLVCDAVCDLCNAGGASFGTMSAVITANSSYICETDGLDIYITDGNSCLRIRIGFGAAAESASASKCSVDEIGTGNGQWYKIDPSDCRAILADR